MWGPQINMAWEVWRMPVLRLRGLANSPTSYYYFEKLAASMRLAAKAWQGPRGQRCAYRNGG